MIITRAMGRIFITPGEKTGEIIFMIQRRTAILRGCDVMLKRATHQSVNPANYYLSRSDQATRKPENEPSSQVLLSRRSNWTETRCNRLLQALAYLVLGMSFWGQTEISENI